MHNNINLHILVLWYIHLRHKKFHNSFLQAENALSKINLTNDLNGYLISSLIFTEQKISCQIFFENLCKSFLFIHRYLTSE